MTALRVVKRYYYHVTKLRRNHDDIKAVTRLNRDFPYAISWRYGSRPYGSTKPAHPVLTIVKGPDWQTFDLIFHRFSLVETPKSSVFSWTTWQFLEIMPPLISYLALGLCNYWRPWFSMVPGSMVLTINKYYPAWGSQPLDWHLPHGLHTQQSFSLQQLYGWFRLLPLRKVVKKITDSILTWVFLKSDICRMKVWLTPTRTACGYRLYSQKTLSDLRLFCICRKPFYAALS